jgi:hypothetical protein
MMLNRPSILGPLKANAHEGRRGGREGTEFTTPLSACVLNIYLIFVDNIPVPARASIFARIFVSIYSSHQGDHLVVF